MVNPGPELDDLIDHHVFGRGPGSAGLTLNRKYSTDISAAWRVVERMRKEYGVVVEISDNSIRVNMKDYRSFPEHKPDAQYFSTTKTLPHLICLAALKAMGVEIE